MEFGIKGAWLSSFNFDTLILGSGLSNFMMMMKQQKCSFWTRK